MLYICLAAAVVVVLSVYLSSIYLVHDKSGLKQMELLKTAAKPCKAQWIMLSVYTVMAVLSVIVFSMYEYSGPRIIRYLVLFCALGFCSYIDVKKRIIPNSVLLWLLLARTGLLVVEIVAASDLWKVMVLRMLLGAAASFVVLWIAALASKGGIGMGDVKLMTIVGYYVGFESILSCITAPMLLFGIFGLTLVAMKKIKLKDALPFAPFIAVGVMLVLFFRL